MTRQNVSSGSPWEAIVGYSRAVRAGAHVFVSGTTASDGAGNVVAKGDPHEQTRFILQKIDNALRECGASLRDVVRTRTFVLDITQWEGIGRAHAEFFHDVMPAATMVQVSQLVHPDLLVEIEVDAVITEAE